MRIVLFHPNYHSGGAEIARKWPPAWVAYLAGALKQAGYADLRFIDGTILDLEDDQLFAILADEEETIHRRTFIAFREEMERRKLPVLWGINTRVTDVLRGEALLPLYRPLA